MKGKVCLITGGNSGIGKITAIELAKKGATVVIVSRNKERGESALKDIKEQSGSDDVDLLLADLAVQSQIHHLAEEFRSRYDRLDVLVNNAGLIVGERTLTSDGIESTFAINHLAYFLLTNLLLDMLKASAPSRIINVASEAHRAGNAKLDDLQSERNYNSFIVYGQSKLYNIMFTYELARRLEGTGVTVNTLHPGTIASNFGYSGTKFFGFLVKLAKPFLKTPEQGAQTTIYLASSPEVEKVTGKYFINSKTARSNSASYNEQAQNELWRISEEMTKVKV